MTEIKFEKAVDAAKADRLEKAKELRKRTNLQGMVFDSVEEKKKYSIKEYNSKSYEKHKGEASTICEICGGSYQYYNKSHHNKSKRHTLCLLRAENNQLKQNINK